MIDQHAPVATRQLAGVVPNAAFSTAQRRIADAVAMVAARLSNVAAVLAHEEKNPARSHCATRAVSRSPPHAGVPRRARASDFGACWAVRGFPDRRRRSA